MDKAMLWYDDDKQRPLTEKVKRAVAYYREKYGIQPTECFVHPSMLDGYRYGLWVGVVKVSPNKTVIRNHLWIGVVDERPKHDS